MADHVEDGVIEYRLYPDIARRDEGIPQDVWLQNYLTECVNTIDPLIGNYLWHYEPFSLQIDNSGRIPHLVGRTEFRDNVEDEWFIVYLVFELTRKFREIVAVVTDSDGQFLLIEAANFIPKWLQPETSKNRVFVSNGDLHIVPIPQTPAQITEYPAGTPSLSQALRLIRKGSLVTRASQLVQSALNKRLGDYPEKAKESIHFCHCCIPAGVAQVLCQRPDLVSAAIWAYCERDPIDMKSLHCNHHFQGHPAVLVSVKLSRFLYARITHEKFQPPKHWIQPQCSFAGTKAQDIGAKLTVGFELLCLRSESRDMAKNPFVSPEWRKYVQSLTQHGYFDGEMQSSKRYTELFEQAKSKFMSSFTFNEESYRDEGAVVLQILSNFSVDGGFHQQKMTDLIPESDDSWLNITREDLDKLMKERSGLTCATEDECDQDGLDHLEAINTAVKSFVGNVSDMEGAEFPQACNSKQVSFDPDSLVDTLSNILNYKQVESEDDSEIDGNENDLLLSDDNNEENDSTDPQLKDYMAQMDEELSMTQLGNTFEKVAYDEDNGAVNVQPVDIDVNLVKNMLESYASQEGLAGPASNLLGSMGILI
jgi:hypothetical protein